MKKNCDCSFLFGQLTDPETVRELHSALQAKSAIQKEIISYKKDGKLMRPADRKNALCMIKYQEGNIFHNVLFIYLLDH